MRQPVSAIRSIGRVTQGVRLVKLDDGTNISSITRVISEDSATEKKDDKQMTLDTDTVQETPSKD